MQTEMRELLEDAKTDEELIDVLIAISVVSRMLARKLQTEKDKEGKDYEQDE